MKKSDVGTETPIFNREDLLERLCGDETLLDDIIHVYLSDTREQIAILRTALAAKDQILVHRQGHSIKGASDNVAAMRMRQVARQVEEAGKAGDLTGVARLVDQMELFFEEFEKHLHQ